MKTIITYIRILAMTSVLLAAFSTIAISQGTDSRKKFTKEEKIFVGLTVTPQTTTINNKDFSSTVPLDHKSGTSLNLALEGGYFFSKMIGISIGAGMGSYSTEQMLDSCSIKFTTTDDDLESYEMRIKGKSISEIQKLSFLNIPVCVVLKIPAGERLGFYVKAGLSFDIPMTKTYEASGTFTYDGYYAAYPVLLHDIPVYFPKDLKTSSDGVLEVKSLSQTLVASGGAFFRLNESIQLSLGVNFNKSLGNISVYEANSSYRITSKPNELFSIMGGTSGAGVTGLGVSLSVRYYIR
jgi:hypothetical protein